MRIYFDDYETAVGDNSGFYLDLLTIPRIGEIVRVHKSLLNPRFLTGDYFEDPLLDKQIFNPEYDLVWLEITEVYYDIYPGLTGSINIGFEFYTG